MAVALLVGDFVMEDVMAYRCMDGEGGRMRARDARPGHGPGRGPGRGPGHGSEAGRRGV